MLACLYYGITENKKTIPGGLQTMRKINAKFNTAFISEAGSLLQNKDYFAFVEMDDFACYVIADGIEDDIELESAKIAVASIIRQFSEKPAIGQRSIKNWLKTANKELLALSRTKRLKASVTVVVTDYVSMVYGMAGNTRLMLFREGTLIHQTSDHSLSNNLMERGVISKDKVASHLERHNLYCYLGQPYDFKPETSSRIKLVEGDIITLFTRGIWENVDDGEITDAVSDAREPQEVLNNVEDLLLSKQPANLDNYTLASIFIDKLYQDPGRRKILIKRILAVAIPVLLIIIGLLIFSHITQAQRQEQVDIMSGHLKQAQMLSEQDNFVKAVDEYKEALDIAQRLKLKNEQRQVESYYKTSTIIVDADTAMHQKEFTKAMEKYNDAMASSYLSDNLGADYISKQQHALIDYMRVSELIQSGDESLEKKDLIKARIAYTEAKVLATRIYFEEGRKEAAEKLAKLNDQMKEDGNQAKEKEAAVYVQQGDAMARKGDFEGAVSMLSIASGMYDQVGKTDKSTAIQQKIDSIEDKMTAGEKAALNEKIAQQAEQYEAEGDQALANGDYSNAQDQYSYARTLYKQSGNKDSALLVQSKIANLNSKQQDASKSDLQSRAHDMEKDGDLKVAQNQFDDARISYADALATYSAGGLSNNVTTVQSKIDLLDQKNTAYEAQKSKAAAYVADADAKTQAGDFKNAKYLYLLAHDIYDTLHLKEEKKQVNEKIKALNRLSK